MKLEKGFYTALGTPLDSKGNLVASSLEEHIEMQINAKASGLLLLGSMGIEAYVKNCAYKDAVKVGASANNGRLPFFVGVMDNSIAKVMERIEMIDGSKIDGVVLTTPFYSKVGLLELANWFSTVATLSPYPLYLYDLPVVTKLKITLPLIDKLINHPNIVGIKSADWELLKAIERKYPEKKFECLYSGLDNFDYANMIGLDKNLDGMFSCCPVTTRTFFDKINEKDFIGARKYLDKILNLRDTMIGFGLSYSFTYCMNEIGLKGNFHKDYSLPITEENKVILKNLLKDMKEI